jgi:16S rRNA (adenine1518-N6/adenine1519-N6)-dimethyltransferase
MVQKEVADRLAAESGSRTYGVPSVKARWYGDVEYAGNIGPKVFWPEPNVDSGLVRITRHDRTDATAATRDAVFRVVDAAFGQRRKALRGALAGLAGSPQASEQALLAAGIDPMARGESLDVADFIRLADALAHA